jgi:hypothetical protein
MSRALSRAILLGLLLLSMAARPAPAVAAPLDPDAYTAWVGDHALRLLALMELPSEFTLGDLRDIAIELGQLVDEAQVVEPPPQYASAHRAYIAGIEQVDRVRAGFQTVVLTRQPVEGLRDTVFDAGRDMASGLRALRDAGVTLPLRILDLLGDAEQQGPGGAPAEQGPPPVEAATSTVACERAAGCATSRGLRLRILGTAGDQTTARALAPPGQAIVAVRARIENLQADAHVVRTRGVALRSTDGRTAVLTHSLNGADDLLPRAGLLLGGGQSAEGVLYFRVPRGFQPQRIRMDDPSAPGGALVVRIP